VTDPGAPDTGIIVHALEVPRTARVATLGGPDADEVWLVVHGYGQLAARFLQGFLPASRPGRLIVAPEALSRFYTSRKPDRVGATWMTREARDSEIRDYLGYLDRVVERFAPGAARVEVHGFSQGTATATRWVHHAARMIGRLVLWGGEIAAELDPGEIRRRQPGMQWELCVGQGDPFITEEAVSRETGRLDSAGVPYGLQWFDGGHEVHATTLSRLAEQ
jgi:predicted esterase